MHDLATIKRLNDEAAQRELGKKKGGENVNGITVQPEGIGKHRIAKDSTTGRLFEYDPARYPEQRVGERRKPR